MLKTIIFANGVSANPNANRRYIAPGDTIICADGGTLHALSLGLLPNLIVGDLDSLPPATQKAMEAGQVKILRHPVKKDQTDLELALSVAVEQNAAEILILTALGGRLDQHLANIFLLTRPEWRSARLRLADGNQQAWLLRGPDRLEICGSPGDTLSVVVLSEQLTGLTLSGVEWPLDQATVGLGSTLTISNTFTSPQVIISAQSGLALVIQISN